MSNKREGFYKAFEDSFRGNRQMIRLRLQVYLPFIQPLREIYPDGLAVDLGCGRGEWLQLLGEHGFSAQGIDIDEEMLEPCRELGLNVENAEALAFIKRLADESVTLISAFHLVEHISFEDLQSLVEESLRVLKPGGLLILETPNPENLVVGTSAFYLDPTHRKPIPPPLLAFLPKYYGFSRTTILRLQEPEDIGGNDRISLLSVLKSVSPDYAVVAQKNAEEEVLDRMRSAFAAEHGVTLDRLATNYDKRVTQIESKIRRAEERAMLAEARAGKAEATAQLAREQAAQAEAAALQAESRARRSEERAEQADARARQAEADLQAVYDSHSWRITQPLRGLVTALRWGRDKSKQLSKRVMVSALFRSIRFANSRPAVKRAVLPWIRQYPGLEARLRRFAIARGLTGMPPAHSVPYAFGDSAALAGQYDLEDLTPRAREIYFQLKTAIEQKDQEKKENN